MEDNKLTAFLQDNPRMIGALFTVMVFLSTTGAASALEAGVYSGP
ncbi:DUF7503 family protein [Halobacterium zhouii]|nr:hypothetical protein [Halobacterium zhouii]